MKQFRKFVGNGVRKIIKTSNWVSHNKLPNSFGVYIFYVVFLQEVP